MRPGIEHIVITLENSIVLGSHFLSEVTFAQSMSSGLREHWWGRYGTNTEHLSSEVLPYRMLGLYHERLTRGEGPVGEKCLRRLNILHLTHLII